MKQLKNILLKLIGWFLALGVALRIFLKWPVFAVSVACIPLNGLFQKHLHLTPVLSKVLAVGIFILLLWISFHVGEIAVALCAIAIVQEALLLSEKFRNRFSAQTQPEPIQ